MGDTLAKLELLSDVNEIIHEHTQIELIYVVKGSCTVQYDREKYRMNREDIILINTERGHSICADRESLVCRISFAYHEICRQMHEDYIGFRCNSTIEAGLKYQELHRRVKEVLLEYAVSSEPIYRLYGLYQLLLSCLLKSFKLTSIRVENHREWEDDEKLAVIKNYIHEHYMDGGSLSALAEKLYLSPSTLSRYFKKMTGDTFVKYIREVRLQKVVEQLVDTETPITRIAVDNGFSSPSVMNKEFKSCFGITPGEYRKNHIRGGQVQEEDHELRQKQQLKEALDIQSICRDSERIEADISICSEYKKWICRLMNVGEAAVLKNAEMQNHILLLKQKLEIEYIRIWSLFSKELRITVNGQKEYNFHYINSILDFCVNHGLKVFFDMGQRTNVAMSSEKKYIYKTEEGIEFESEEEWIQMLEHFCRHIRTRYREEVWSSWIFEFSFFLNERPYYISPDYSSRRVWNLGCGIIKKYLPDAKIAGPGLTAGMSEDLQRAVLDSFFSTDYRPDIFTTFIFPYASTEFENQYRRIHDTDYIKKQIYEVRKELHERGFTGAYYVTDWNNSFANRNYVQDSCYRGTFFLKNILDNYETVDMMGIWYASDLLNMYYDSYAVLSGSGGILSKDGICKPAFYALSFLKHMGTYKVAQGDNYLITKDSDSMLYILCYNNKSLGYQYYLSEEDMYKPGEVAQLFQNQDRLNLKIELKNLSIKGRYTIRQKILNEDVGGILNKWGELGFEEDLVDEDVEYLRRMSVPEIRIEHVQVHHNTLCLEMTLEPHEMRWISIRCLE